MNRVGENIQENSGFITLEKTEKSLPKYKVEGLEVENLEIEEEYISATGKMDLVGMNLILL